MIEILEQSSEACLAVRFSGKVSGQEYQQFLEAIHQRLESSEKISLVCELINFEFYEDVDSAKKDLQFAFKEYKQISKAAFVGDQKWVSWFTHLIQPFTRTEEKHFAQEQLDEALKWACT